MVAANTLSSLPDIDSLCRLSQSLALLEAVLCPRVELRYYLFDALWGAGETLASMSNGAGDHYFILFTPAGAVIKGFDHESEMSPHAGDGVSLWAGVLDSVPAEFRASLDEPALVVEDTTFCLWRRYGEDVWQTGEIDYPRGDAEADGSGWMLPTRKLDPAGYCEWAHGYHDAIVEPEVVSRIYGHEPLTEQTVRQLNPDQSLADVAADAAQIGYPVGGA